MKAIATTLSLFTVISAASAWAQMDPIERPKVSIKDGTAGIEGFAPDAISPIFTESADPRVLRTQVIQQLPKVMRSNSTLVLTLVNATINGGQDQQNAEALIRALNSPDENVVDKITADIANGESLAKATADALQIEGDLAGTWRIVSTGSGKFSPGGWLNESKAFLLDSNNGESFNLVKNAKAQAIVSNLVGQYSGVFYFDSSADGSRFIIGSRDYSEAATPALEHATIPMPNGGIRIVDSKTGQVLKLIKNSNIRRLSPDGKLVAISENPKTLRIEDVDTGKIVYQAGGSFSNFESVEFSYDGTRILVNGGFFSSSASMIDLASGKTLFKAPIGSSWFLPNGDAFLHVTSSGYSLKSVSLRDINSGNILFEQKLDAKSAPSIEASPGPHAFISADGKLIALEIGNFTERSTMIINRTTGKSTIVPNLAFGDFSPDGKSVSVQSVTTAAIVDTTTFETVFKFQPTLYFQDIIRDTTFSANDSLQIRRESGTVVGIQR